MIILLNVGIIFDSGASIPENAGVLNNIKKIS
jgi:hypothetical protein